MTSYWLKASACFKQASYMMCCPKHIRQKCLLVFQNGHSWMFQIYISLLASVLCCVSTVIVSGQKPLGQGWKKIMYGLNHSAGFVATNWAGHCAEVSSKTSCVFPFTTVLMQLEQQSCDWQLSHQVFNAIDCTSTRGVKVTAHKRVIWTRYINIRNL